MKHFDDDENYFLADGVVDCGRLDNPENGFVVFTTTTVGSPAQYSCKLGYLLLGEDIRVCTETGEWSDEEPECVRKSER